MKILSLFLCLGILASTEALAQNSQELERKIVAEKIQTELRQAVGYAIDARSVKGAPYAASAENETTQMLADGNRIHNKTTTQIYRDSEGRTRREVQSKSGGLSQIFINDPVAGLSLTLDPSQRVATKRETVQKVVLDIPLTVSDNPVKLESLKQLEKERTLSLSRVATDEAMTTAKKQAVEREAQARLATGIQLPRISTAELSPMIVSDLSYSEKAGKKEALGKQMIEGVLCEGKRTTITIPANSIGNDLPINIVTEEWFSPELQVQVMTRHSDPRMGETVYRLTGIVRGEQPKDLFELPSDYTVRDLSKPVMTRKMKEEQ